MVYIIIGTSTFFTVAEGNDMGVRMIPLCVSIQDEHYRDLYFDTSSFPGKARSGGTPTTSQPPTGDVLAAYREHGDEEILSICTADGLSGTYQTALMAEEQTPSADNITILNLQTLCGPHRHLVEKAVKLRGEGKKAAGIVAALKESMTHRHSSLIPQDYSFLERSGYLKPTAASISGLLKLKPVMHAVEDGSRLDRFTVIRTLSKTTDFIISHFREHGVGVAYRVSVSHTDALANARFFTDRLKDASLDTELELLELSPTFITQGGLRCIAVRYIRKWSGDTLPLYRRFYMGKQNRGNRCLLIGYVVSVIAAGLLSRSALSLPDWFREYEGDMLWLTMMRGIFALLFPEARVKSLSIVTLLFSCLVKCSQSLNYDWLNTLCAALLHHLLRQDLVWSDLLCYNTDCTPACSLDVVMLKRRRGIYG